MGQGLRGLVRTFKSWKCQDRDAVTFSDRDAGKGCVCELEAQIPGRAISLVCGCGDTWRAEWGGSNTMGSEGGGGPRPGEVGNQVRVWGTPKWRLCFWRRPEHQPQKAGGDPESPGKLSCEDSAVWTSAEPSFL